jgi:hypothetical protein
MLPKGNVVVEDTLPRLGDCRPSLKLRRVYFGGLAMTVRNFTLILLLFWMHFSFQSFGQSTFSVSGKIVNAKTKEPVPFASIFLARTMIGQRSDDNGFFKLTNIPPGKYELTVSSVGYHLSHTSIEVTGNIKDWEVEMDPEIQVLKTAVVTASRSEYLQLLRIFKQYFIGTTRNADKCTIKNPDQIDLVFDKDENTLTASCAVPIEIENKALGYRIFYTLEEFALEFNANKLTLAGYPLFDTLKAENKETRAKWITQRDRAYYGSLTHFMRSLRSDKLTANQFNLFYWREAFSVRGSGRLSLSTFYPGGYYMLSVYDFRNMPADSLLKLRITYKGANQEYNFDPKRFKQRLPQTSLFNYLEYGLVIYENGYFDDPLSFYMDGYMGWKEKVMAELLPFEFQPAITLKQKKQMDLLERQDSLERMKGKGFERNNGN